MKADIIQELEYVKQWNMDKDGKRQVMPKDKVKEFIGRSPDFSDTLMMREWFELMPQRSWAIV
jgi:phage terminase large subunit